MALPAAMEDNFNVAEQAFTRQYEVLRDPDDPTGQRERILGQGTFGVVVQARCRRTENMVALKRMRLNGDNDEGIPATAIREISILKELPHENIVRLFDVFCRPGRMVLVFELLESDLKKYMRSNGAPLTPPVIREFTRQLLVGLEFCHARRIIHRDLKPQNLLIHQGVTLKIADFGLARALMLPVPQYTHEVVTVWYRPLEILLGSRLYSLPVDIWGVGCIMAEMATSQPLFTGDSEIDTAFKIFQKLGTPTEAQWPGVMELPDFKATFPQWRHKGWNNIRNTAVQVGTSGIELLEQLMKYDPRARISARQALTQAYFA